MLKPWEEDYSTPASAEIKPWEEDYSNPTASELKPLDEYSWLDQTDLDIQKGWIGFKEALSSAQYSNKLENLENLGYGNIDLSKQYSQNLLPSKEDIQARLFSEYAQDVSNYAIEKEALGEDHPDVTQGLQRASAQDGWWDTVKAVVGEPKALSSVIAKSFSTFAPVLLVGALTRGKSLPASMGVMGYGSYQIEYSNVVREGLVEAGVDITNADDVKKAFADIELFSAIKEKAHDRGIPIAVFDALSMGIAGKLYRPIKETIQASGGALLRSAGTVAGLGSEMVLQAGMGASGEVGAQLATEGKITDKADVLYEAFAELPTGAVETAVSIPRANPAKQFASELQKQVDATRQLNPQVIDNMLAQQLQETLNPDQVDYQPNLESEATAEVGDAIDTFTESVTGSNAAKRTDVEEQPSMYEEPAQDVGLTEEEWLTRNLEVMSNKSEEVQEQFADDIAKKKVRLEELQAKKDELPEIAKPDPVLSELEQKIRNVKKERRAFKDDFDDRQGEYTKEHISRLRQWDIQQAELEAEWYSKAAEKNAKSGNNENAQRNTKEAQKWQKKADELKEIVKEKPSAETKPIVEEYRTKAGKPFKTKAVLEKQLKAKGLTDQYTVEDKDGGFVGVVKPQEQVKFQTKEAAGTTPLFNNMREEGEALQQAEADINAVIEGSLDEYGDANEEVIEKAIESKLKEMGYNNIAVFGSEYGIEGYYEDDILLSNRDIEQIIERNNIYEFNILTAKYEDGDDRYYEYTVFDATELDDYKSGRESFARSNGEKVKIVFEKWGLHDVDLETSGYDSNYVIGWLTEEDQENGVDGIKVRISGHTLPRQYTGNNADFDTYDTRNVEDVKEALLEIQEKYNLDASDMSDFDSDIKFQAKLAEALKPKTTTGLAQQSSEALPSKGLLAGRMIARMPLETQQQYQTEVNDILGTFVEDIIGLELVSAVDAPSNYEGHTGVSRQTVYKVTTELDADGFIVPTAESREKLKSAAALIGYVLEQDSVANSFLAPVTSLDQADASSFNLGRPINNEEMIRVNEAITAAGVNPDDIAIVSTKEGVNLLNVSFGDLDNAGFIDVSGIINSALSVKERVEFYRNTLLNESIIGSFDGYKSGQEVYAEIARLGKIGNAGRGDQTQQWWGYADSVAQKLQEIQTHREEFLRQNPRPRKTIRQIGEEADALAKQNKQTLRLNDYSEKAQETIASRMYDESVAILKGGDKEARGWYTTKYQQALDRLSNKHPELAQGKDQTARDLFTTFVAITSDGAKVPENLKFAEAVYRSYQKTGKVNAHIPKGERTASYRKNLNLLQRLIDEKGLKGTIEFLQETDEVRNIEKELGINLSGFSKDLEMPKSTIFGSKLGMFLANLMGQPDYLTMDRWWSRTFNRLRGQMTVQPTAASVQRFKELLGKPNAQTRTWKKEARRIAIAYGKRNFKDGTPLEKVANTIHKTLIGLRDSPAGVNDRAFQQRTTEGVVKSLHEAGYKDITVSDLQAILWYGEKRRMKEMGSKPPVDEWDYSDAAKLLDDETGVEDSVQFQSKIDARQNETNLEDESFEEDNSADINALKKALSKRTGESPDTVEVRQGNLAMPADSRRDIEEAFGKRIVAIRTGEGVKWFNGAILVSRPDVIYVAEDSESPHLTVVGHEMLHAMRVDNPELYQQLLGTLTPYIQNTYQYKAMLDKQAAENNAQPETLDAVREEIFADILGDNFASEVFWSKVAIENESTFKKIHAWIKRWLAKLVEKLGGKRRVSGIQGEERFDAEGRRKNVRFGRSFKYTKDLVEAQDAMAKVMRKYVKARSGDKDALRNLKDDAIKFMVAYHGTAQDFDEFSTDSIRADGGSQLFGWGMYFSNNKEVAEFYKKDAIQNSRVPLKGNIYKVDLAPVEEDYLLWDESIEDQSEKVQAIIKKITKKYNLGASSAFEGGRSDDLQNGEAVYRAIMVSDAIMPDMSDPESTGSFHSAQQSASLYLLSQGIRGIKYREGTPRNYSPFKKRAIDYNYVIFDEKDISVEAKFQTKGDLQGAELKKSQEPAKAKWPKTNRVGDGIYETNYKGRNFRIQQQMNEDLVPTGEFQLLIDDVEHFDSRLNRYPEFEWVNTFWTKRNAIAAIERTYQIMLDDLNKSVKFQTKGGFKQEEAINAPVYKPLADVEVLSSGNKPYKTKKDLVKKIREKGFEDIIEIQETDEGFVGVPKGTVVARINLFENKGKRSQADNYLRKIAEDYYAILKQNKRKATILQHKIITAVKDKKRREAITRYIEGQKVELSEVELRITKQIQKFIEEMGQTLKDEGIVESFLANYIPHYWDIKPKQTSEFLEVLIGGGGAGTAFSRGKKRTLPTYEAGIALGFKPKTLDVAEIIKMYADSVAKTKALKSTVRRLESKMMSKVLGFPLIIKDEFRFMGDDKVTRVMKNKKATERRDKDGYTRYDHFLLRDYYVHPEAKLIFDHIFYTNKDGGIKKFFFGLNYILKRNQVALSLFHATVLGQNYFLTGASYNPFKVKKLLHQLRNGDDGGMIDFAIASGLGINGTEDMLAQDDVFYAGMNDLSKAVSKMGAGKLADKLGIPYLGKANAIDGYVAMNKAMDKFMWDTIMTGGKLVAFVDKFGKLRADTANDHLSDIELGRKIAKFLNDAQGGQDWLALALGIENKMLRDLALKVTSPNLRKWMQIILFAPDWTLSNIRVQGKAATQSARAVLNRTGNIFGIEALKNIETDRVSRKLYNSYQIRSIMWYAVVGTALQCMWGEECRPVWENEDPARVDRGNGETMMFFKQFTEYFHWFTNPFGSFLSKMGNYPKWAMETVMRENYINTRNFEIFGEDKPESKSEWELTWKRKYEGDFMHTVRKFMPIWLSAVLNAPEGKGFERFIHGQLAAPIYGTPKKEK